MRLIAAINTGLDADLVVHTLFDAPTIAQLAPRLGGDGSRREPLAACQRPAVIPLSFTQNRLWFLAQLQGPSAVYNMTVALKLRGTLDAEALSAALADVVARHESLRTLFPAARWITSAAHRFCRAGGPWFGCHRCHRMAASPTG